MLFLYSSVQSTRWTCMAAPRKGSTPLAVRPLPLARTREGASPALARSPGALPGQSTQPSTTAYMTTAAPMIPRPAMPLRSWESGRHDRDARGVLVVAGARGGSSRIFTPLAASRTNRRQLATPQAAEGSHRTRDHEPRHRLEDALRLGLRQIGDGAQCLVHKLPRPIVRVLDGLRRQQKVPNALGLIRVARRQERSQ